MPPTSTLILIGVLALAAFLLMRTSAGIFARTKRKDADPKELRQLLGERSRDSALADAPVDVLRWQVELHETARDLKAEIDSKLAALQAVALLARQERQRLENAICRAEQVGLPARGAKLPAAMASDDADEPPRDPLAVIEALADPAALADPRAIERAIARLPARS